MPVSTTPSPIRPFSKTLADHGLKYTRHSLQTLQVNVGKLCNQACSHCHVDAGPQKKRENMGEDAFARLLVLIDRSEIESVDITGGAPELNPNFRGFVKELRSRGIQVIDRCNLTVLFEPGQEDTAQFLAEQRVTIVASLPCYSENNVDSQRGDGVFAKSIRALQRLNGLGYGSDDQLIIDLVYNPLGANLPPDQGQLEQEYKARLYNDFKIKFNHLFTITNMPIKRFLFDLKRQGKHDEYMATLVNAFNPSTVGNLMCRSLYSIGWDGKIYDCDFNQMLDMPTGGKERTIWEIESFADLANTKIGVGNHCYGCTAGAGSSCKGILTETGSSVLLAKSAQI